MSEIQVNALTKGVIVDGLPNPSAIYINPITKKPWTSVQEFLTIANDSLIDVVPHMHILVGTSFSTAKEYYNKDGGTTFTEYSTGGNSPSMSVEGPVYVISAEAYNLTKGEIEKGSDGHYTADQYAKMRQNSIGITKAIKDAYENGFRSIKLEQGTYCFCPRSYMQNSTEYGIPAIYMYDMDNVIFDLNGSELKIILDSNQASPYVQATSMPWKIGMTLINIAYCNNCTITNGTLTGDRFIRDYLSSESKSYLDWEACNESTHGIAVMTGNTNINITDIEFKEFMGDGVTGTATSFFYKIPEESDTAATWGCWASAQSASHYENTYVIGEAGRCVKSTKNFDTSITDAFDLNSLYPNTYGLKNRQKHKDERTFMLCSTGGYNRLPKCYPGRIDVITFSSNAEDATPIRMFSSAYMQKFSVGKNERYVKLQFHHCDNIKPEWDSTKTYTYTDYVLKSYANVLYNYRCLQTTTGSFDNSKWERVSVATPNTDETYDSTHTYEAGDTVTHSIGEGYLCYRAKSAGTTGSWVDSKWELQNNTIIYRPSIDPVIAIGECHTWGLNIERCQFKNCHRGSISNTPCNTIVRDCQFHKYMKLHKDDGYPAPNFASKMDCTNSAGNPTLGETTNYFIDLEDYVASSFRMVNCEFDTNHSATGKILLNTLANTIEGCQGIAPITIYNASSSTFVINNDFHEFYLENFQGNLRNEVGGDRYWRRNISLIGNKVHWTKMAHFDPYTQDVIIADNTIFLDTNTSTTTFNYWVNRSGGIKFSNNAIHFTKNGEGIKNDLWANSITGTSCDVKGEITLASPCVGSASVLKAGQFTLESDIDDNKYSGLHLICDNIQLATLKKSTSAEHVWYFENMIFESTSKQAGCIMIQSYAQRAIPSTHKLYFKNCKFIAKNIPVGYPFFAFYPYGVMVTGDKAELSFEGCEFDIVNNSFATDSEKCTYTLEKCKNCTFNKDIKFNGVTMVSSAPGIGNGTLTFKNGDSVVATFSANQDSNVEVNLSSGSSSGGGSSTPTTGGMNTDGSNASSSAFKNIAEEGLVTPADTKELHKVYDSIVIKTTVGGISYLNIPLPKLTDFLKTYDQLGSYFFKITDQIYQSNVVGLADALASKALASHGHYIKDITNLQGTLDGKANSSHTHSIADVTNLETTLAGKASSSHTHTTSDITGLAKVATTNKYSDLSGAPTVGNGKITFVDSEGKELDSFYVNTSEDKQIVMAGGGSTIKLDTDFTNPSDTKAPSIQAVKTELDKKLNISDLPDIGNGLVKFNDASGNELARLNLNDHKETVVTLPVSEGENSVDSVIRNTLDFDANNTDDYTITNTSTYTDCNLLAGNEYTIIVSASTTFNQFKTFFKFSDGTSAGLNNGIYTNEPVEIKYTPTKDVVQIGTGFAYGPATTPWTATFAIKRPDSKRLATIEKGVEEALRCGLLLGQNKVEPIEILDGVYFDNTQGKILSGNAACKLAKYLVCEGQKFHYKATYAAAAYNYVTFTDAFRNKLSNVYGNYQNPKEGDCAVPKDASFAYVQIANQNISSDDNGIWMSTMDKLPEPKAITEDDLYVHETNEAIISSAVNNNTYGYIDSEIPAFLVIGQSNADGRIPNDDFPSSIEYDGLNVVMNKQIPTCNFAKNTLASYALSSYTGSTTYNFSTRNNDSAWAFDDIIYNMIADKLGEGKPFYVVKCTLGGTGLGDPKKSPNSVIFSFYPDLSAYKEKNGYHDGCMPLVIKLSCKRAFELMPNLSFKAIFMHQGENDCSRLAGRKKGTYFNDLANLIDFCRSAVHNQDCPFIFGSVPTNSRDYDEMIYTDMQKIQEKLPKCHLITMGNASNWLNDGMNVHFLSADAIKLAKGMWKVILDNNYL